MTRLYMILVIFALIILKTLRLPWTIQRHYRKKLIFKWFNVYRAAYRFALWVESHSKHEGETTLQTDIGPVIYQKPLTMRKLVKAIRDRR